MGAAAMALAAVGAATSKLVPAAVLTTTTLRLTATGVYHWTGSSTWKSTAGYIGLLLAALALYAALAIHLEDVTGKMILPLARRGKAVTASTGSLDDQVAEVEHEPGVRNQL
jgi:succinate-acetate transporter protein